VQVEAVADAGVRHGEHERLPGVAEADVGHQPLVEDGVDDGAVVRAALRVALQGGPLGGHGALLC
jgi:hypothetical protein